MGRMTSGILCCDPYRQKLYHDQLPTYHIFSPLQHAVRWQLRSVDGGSLEPCWQAQAEDHGPEGEDDLRSATDSLWLL